MPLECPACGRGNPETARRCDCGRELPDRAAQSGAGKRPEGVPTHCPHCQGTNIRSDGWTGLDARVQFGGRWMGTGNAGYGLNCFACLDCGFVGHYLCTADLEHLREKPVMTDWPPRSSRSGCAGVLLLAVSLALLAGVLVGWVKAG